MPETEVALTSKADKFIESASTVWKSFKVVKKALGPFSRVSTALDLANKAASGELPAYNPKIEKLRVFVAGQKDQLASLAQKDENYWIDLSGVNLFDRSTILPATAYFDEWILKFSQLKELIAQLLPLARTAQTLLSNSATVAVRSALAESSLPALDGIALSEIVGDLNNSAWSAAIILRRLKNCRLTLR